MTILMATWYIELHKYDVPKNAKVTIEWGKHSWSDSAANSECLLLMNQDNLCYWTTVGYDAYWFQLLCEEVPPKVALEVCKNDGSM